MNAASRGTAVALAAVWPLGVLLALANQEVEAVTTPVFLVVAVAYAATATALLLRLGAHRHGPVGILAVAPVALFTFAGYTSEPSGKSPDLLMINTAVLLAVSVALCLAGCDLLLRHRHSSAARFAATTTALLLLGTAGYLVNLFGRFAVVLAGLSQRQGALEDDYWNAAEYLRGLPTSSDPLAYVLTWMDLVQLGYVVTAYAAAAGLARLLRTEGVVSARAGRTVERCSWAAAGLLTGSIAIALALPHELDAAPAGVAFALSIPFMTTLLPFALAASALLHTTVPGRVEPLVEVRTR